MKLFRFSWCVLSLMFAFTSNGNSQSATSVDWKIDNLKLIGGKPLIVAGHPLIIPIGRDKAVQFNGVDDGLAVTTNAIAGASAFTIEAVFRPDAGGDKEQRWFHIQQDQSENRVLLETRLVGNQWFLDTYIRSGDQNRTLFAEDFKHPLGAWYHVALIYDGTEMRHYVDGQQEMAGPLTIAPLGQGLTSIGVRMNRMYWFKGAVSKARFTPRALTPKEFMAK